MANSNPSWIMTEILCLPLGDSNAQTRKGHPLNKARGSPGLLSLSWTFLLFLFATSSPVNSNLFSISCQMTSSVDVCGVNRQYALVCVGILSVVGDSSFCLFLGIWNQPHGTSHTCVAGSQGGVSVYSPDWFLKKKKWPQRGSSKGLNKKQACTSLSGAIKWTLFTFSCLPALYRLHLFSSSSDWSSSNLLTPHQASPSLSHQPLWTVPTLNYQSLFICLDTTGDLFLHCRLDTATQPGTDWRRLTEYLSSQLLENKKFKVRIQT